MPKQKPVSEWTGLDVAIDTVFSEMAGAQSDSREYSAMVDQLTKLYSIKAEEKRDRVSPDTLAIVIGNLIGIAMIVGHERMHVVSSKALNFILKLR